jgi:hypothetical protein
MVADERLTALQKLAEHPASFKALELLANNEATRGCQLFLEQI